MFWHGPRVKHLGNSSEAKAEMKRLALLVGGLLLVMLLVAAGCAHKALPEEEVVSSCVSCHSDKDLLKQTATPVKEETSEATSGEG
jgi:hypothetical protein